MRRQHEALQRVVVGRSQRRVRIPAQIVGVTGVEVQNVNCREEIEEARADQHVVQHLAVAVVDIGVGLCALLQIQQICERDLTGFTFGSPTDILIKLTMCCILQGSSAAIAEWRLK